MESLLLLGSFFAIFVVVILTIRAENNANKPQKKIAKVIPGQRIQPLSSTEELTPETDNTVKPRARY